MMCLDGNAKAATPSDEVHGLESGATTSAGEVSAISKEAASDAVGDREYQQHCRQKSQHVCKANLPVGMRHTKNICIIAALVVSSTYWHWLYFKLSPFVHL